MSELERLARALVWTEHSGAPWGGYPNAQRNAPFDDMDEHERGFWINCVSAILTAMREPSEDLTDTLQASLDCVPINRCVEQSRQVWQNGIDHILSGGS